MKKIRGGFTVVELLIAVTLLSVIVVLGMQVAFGSAITVNTMHRTVSIDALGGRAIHEISALLRSAILPYKPAVTGSGLGGGENASGEYEANPSSFEDLDSKAFGFGGTNGKTWLSELKTGVDSIAFVAPVAARKAMEGPDGTFDTDILDHSLHLQVGYDYGGVSYLSASASGDPEVSFKFRGPGELVSALAALDPRRLNNISFESIENPTLDEWRDLEFGGTFSWPDVTCFMAIRFVPVMRTATDPLEIREKNILAHKAKSGVDLDGDGAMDGVFQIGRLQLVYSGGNDFYHVDASGSIVRGPFTQKIRNLTPNVVLRRTNGPREPIFKLIDSDTQALAIELLMLNAGDVDLNTGLITLPPTVKAAEAKRFKTSILLKNMAMR